MSASSPKMQRGRHPLSQLSLEVSAPAQSANSEGWIAPPGKRAIEDETFPFELISDVAEAESWRKEIHRPIHYVHKWWARRLGTVFRSIVVGALAPAGSDVMQLFYGKARFPGAIVFDPFMGSGVTLGEAVKLGARAIGRDINPVAHFLVRNALGKHDRSAVVKAFQNLQRDVAPIIRRYYRAKLPDGREGEALYYFWVKQLRCPSCDGGVDLLSSRVFAQHAYAKKNPRAQSTCPCCGDVNEVRYDTRRTTCRRCKTDFDPQSGPGRGQKAHCPSCQHEFGIAEAVRRENGPPSHRLYAKLVLTPQGEKVYLPPDGFDFALFAEAGFALAKRKLPYPVVEIQPGYNTNQALGYQYRRWDQFFNSRQLLCLSLLIDGIRAVEDEAARELLTCLFSGALEFNNMFASYKGEGTGAVRHMFSHHILKPERVPIEANLWGTPASSGSFSGLFESRILRALDYAQMPAEIRVPHRGAPAEKIYGLSDPIGFRAATTFSEFEGKAKRVYLSCGDSAHTDIADDSVDAVITDPPFFDNVHYSQLADFFHVWQRHILGSGGLRKMASTRAAADVQDEDGASFARKLGDVLVESRRVLKPAGLLVFSYHHSREEGWSAVLEALMHAEFRVTAAHPIKAEMSVAQPKLMAKEPIDLDVILVCRKRPPATGETWLERSIWPDAEEIAIHQVARFVSRGRKLSRNDVRVIVMAQALIRLSAAPTIEGAVAHLEDGQAAAIIDRLHLHARASLLTPDYGST